MSGKPVEANPVNKPTETSRPQIQPTQFLSGKQEPNQLNPDSSNSHVTAINYSAPPTIPVLPIVQPIEQTENELIQRISGKTIIKSVTPTRPLSSAFIPPTSMPIGITNSTVSEASPNRPLLITAEQNSDVGLGLLTTKNTPLEINNQQPVYSPLPTNSGNNTAQLLQPINTDSKANYSAPALTPISSNQGQLEPRNSLNTPLLRSTALKAPQLQLQAIYLKQGDQSSARARLSAVYPLTPRILFGTTLDLTNGTAFSDSRAQGLQLNELYIATSLQDLPNLRVAVGQLDLTSYFDRNSFAKDGATHFFNSTFQTNPALSATGISSRPGMLVNWSLTDNIEAKAAIFSSARNIGNFTMDAFAGEIGLRYKNAIIRGTYVSDRDAGLKDGFPEIFRISRGNGNTGILPSDREESYGANAEVFIPKFKLGIFGRYGHYQNTDLKLGGDTYSLGINFLDLFAKDDRLGIAYGQNLSNSTLRRESGDQRPDVVELFYDFRFLSNLRIGLSVQQLNNFSESVLGFRVKTDFDVTPLIKKRF